MKALKIGTNLGGKRFAIVPKGPGFAVFAECINYAGHVHGSYAKTWRMVVPKGKAWPRERAGAIVAGREHLTREEAEALFAKRVAGKV